MTAHRPVARAVRRAVAALAAAALQIAAGPAVGPPLAAQASTAVARPSAAQVLDTIRAHLGGSWTPAGVDVVKDGDPATPVTGVAVAMMSTLDVLQRAVAAGANLVITHEPTFYSHLDALAPLEAVDDALTARKRAYIRDHGLVVFRLHDRWHAPRRTPDPFVRGFFRSMDWLRHQSDSALPIVTLPPRRARDVARDVTRRLGIDAARLVGDPRLAVRRVAFLPGASGFALHRGFLARPDVDLVIIGEAAEWEGVAYAADLVTEGRPKALLVLGHVPSERAGMAEFATWLRPVLGTLPVVEVVTAEPFRPVRR